MFDRHAVASILLAVLFSTVPNVLVASETPVIGGKRDANGCLTSAGETYSTLRKTCLQLFEEGIRLDPQFKQGSAVISAFIVFASGDKEGEGDVEVFLPTRRTSFLMRQVKGDNAGIWKSRTLTLNQWKGMYLLDNAKGKTLYQGMAAR